MAPRPHPAEHERRRFSWRIGSGHGGVSVRSAQGGWGTTD
ncbi:putative protein without homology [Propionibacterium freudenreichii subsp. shermanii]|nr:putative protein without homology [Propionibacterium freudenreichii subsp. shermanii]